jgi:hypothetical protein
MCGVQTTFAIVNNVDILDVIVPDLYVVTRQFCEAVEGAERVVIIVED